MTRVSARALEVEQDLRLSELRRLGGGREAEIFDVGDGRVLRLARDPRRGPSVEREVTALAAAQRAGAPVPTVYKRVSVDGCPGAIMERLDGDDLLSRLGRRPWSVWSIGQALGRVHARLHGVAAPADLPALRDEVRNRLGSELVPADLRDSALARLGDLPDGAQLCHGDFHPANLLRAGDGYAVIDWSLGARGHPAADVARTRLLIAQAGIPADAPRAVRWLARLGRRVLLSAYLRGYRKERSLDLKLVERWASVLATVRLADDIPEELAGLLAQLR